MTGSDQQLRSAFAALVREYEDREPSPELMATARVMRQRRRRVATTLTAVAVLAVTLAIVVPISIGGSNGRPRPSVAHQTHPPSPPRRPARLRAPGALTIGPHGSLYIADDTDNQILARHPNGTYTVVAGNGHRGFSGDGGPAAQAELAEPSGMVYDRATRTLYFADEGNNRIRAINAAGTIHTVVGGAPYQKGHVQSGTPPTSAWLVSPGDVTLDPNGRLVVADTGASEILRLNRNNTLTVLAGNVDYAGVYGVGRPATKASADGPSGVAYDSNGNLWITGDNTKTLLYIDHGGILREPPNRSVYARGDGGVLPALPGGAGNSGAGVYLMNDQSLQYRTVNSTKTLADLTGRPLDGIRGVLPEGLAAGHGRLYFDTHLGNGFSNGSGLWALNLRTKRITPLWLKRHHP